jgi:hypothetical protein
VEACELRCQRQPRRGFKTSAGRKPFGRHDLRMMLRVKNALLGTRLFLTG